MNNQLAQIKTLLKAASRPQSKPIFFKTSAGEYAEHDQFINVPVPVLRTIAKEFKNLSLEDIQTLIASPINEERQLALFILIHQYQKGNSETKEKLYQFYLENLQHVNNWNLVDASAHLIIGAHLEHANKDLLFKLANSNVMWERRIAIVATWHCIRKNNFELTIKIAKLLLGDKDDLIHKAVGWMLREAGKRDEVVLVQFLDEHANSMPRTMLRYAIEKFPEPQRKAYLRS